VRVRALLTGLGCSPAEVLALAVLAAAAVAALGLLVIATEGRAVAGGVWAGTARVAAPGVEAPGVERAGGTAPDGLRVAPPPPEQVVVHVVGRVAVPGVYRLAEGARVEEALAAAGGTLADAALESLNLARPLADGEQVIVRAVGDPAPGPAPGHAGGGVAAGPPAMRPDGLLDLNLATAADLEELPGVGPVLAERILAHRESVGGRFTSVGQLREVPGIGESRFQTIAELVIV